MGTESIWVPILLTAAGVGVNEYNNRRTARRQDELLAQGITEQSKRQREATQRINQVVDELAKSGPAAEKAPLLKDFMATIERNRKAALAGLDVPGAVSAAYQTAAGQQGASTIDYAGRVADLLSTVDAATNQRRREAERSGNVSMDLGRLGAEASQQEYLARLRASQVRPNFWLNLLGAGLSGAGMASAANRFTFPGSVDPNAIQAQAGLKRGP